MSSKEEDRLAEKRQKLEEVAEEARKLRPADDIRLAKNLAKERLARKKAAGRPRRPRGIIR